MKAIATSYNGRNYRSRLEARWAAMFDLLEWRYEYEPYDLDGWIPDFAIYGAKAEILVEVKPYSSYREFFDSGTTDKIYRALSESQRLCSEVLLLGATLTSGDDGHCCDDLRLGWLLDDYGDGHYEHDAARFNLWNGKWGFIGGCGGWHDRITGLYDGANYVYIPDGRIIGRMWSEAANRVQWKGRAVA